MVFPSGFAGLRARFAASLRRVAPFPAALALVGTGLVAPIVHAQAVKTDYVEAELIAERRALVAGEPATLALRLKHAPHWHTYWRNPGDSGLPTRIEWTLPAGYSAGPIEWPTPRRIPIPPLANYGYEDELLLPVQLAVPSGALPGNVTVKARADWLVCKDVCIPGGADLQLTLPLVQGSPAIDERWTKLFERTRAAMPEPAAGWQVSARGEGDRITLALRPAAGVVLGPVKSAYFFSEIEGLVEPAGAQAVKLADGALELTLPVSAQLTADGKSIAGVLVTDRPLPGQQRAAIGIAASMSGAIAAGKPPAAAAAPETLGGYGAGDLTLALAIGLALLGGMILNLMPCVFPVLSIKILGMAEQAHGNARAMRAHGIAYTLGVLAAFLALAGVLLALRASGEALGWGFQLQSPIVVALLALLFFALALNLSGVFEVLVPVPDAPTRPSHHPLAAAFGSGVLAAVVASPCTAPFMGAALGFALTQSALVALAVFAALGLGMALPYLALSWFPAWVRRLPRPGPWLAHLKQLLAFPLYATVVWLVWVLGLQGGVDAVLMIGLALVVVALAAWLLGLAQRGAGARFRLGSAAAFVAAIGLAAASWTGEAPIGRAEALPAQASEGSAGVQWAEFSRERVAELVASGKPVFVDFTAAWCVTCQVNKKLVLDRPATTDAFARHSVQLMRADWTRRDEAITRALADLGRNGVPVYVLYRPGKAPLVLPELLQERLVREALSTL